MAIELAANGATVDLCGPQRREAGPDGGHDRSSNGGQAEAISCDVKDGASVDKLVEAVVEKHGRLDILVNNAGITRDTLLPRMSDEEWDDVIETNLRGAFLFARAASRVMMRARYGRIINISSVSGLIGNAGQTNYSASKAGLIGMTRSLSRELAKRNVTVNAVAPGFIESDMTKTLGDALLDEVKKHIPARRLGKAGGSGRGRAVPGQPGGGLRHRLRADGRWRDDGLSHPQCWVVDCWLGRMEALTDGQSYLDLSYGNPLSF